MSASDLVYQEDWQTVLWLTCKLVLEAIDVEASDEWLTVFAWLPVLNGNWLYVDLYTTYKHFSFCLAFYFCSVICNFFSVIFFLLCHPYFFFIDVRMEQFKVRALIKKKWLSHFYIYTYSCLHTWIFVFICVCILICYGLINFILYVSWTELIHLESWVSPRIYWIYLSAKALKVVPVAEYGMGISSE